MLGDLKKIEDLSKEFQVDLSHAQLVDPSQSDNLTKYSEILYEARKHKVQICFSYDEFSVFDYFSISSQLSVYILVKHLNMYCAWLKFTLLGF